METTTIKQNEYEQTLLSFLGKLNYVIIPLGAILTIRLHGNGIIGNGGQAKDDSDKDGYKRGDKSCSTTCCSGSRCSYISRKNRFWRRFVSACRKQEKWDKLFSNGAKGTYSYIRPVGVDSSTNKEFSILPRIEPDAPPSYSSYADSVGAGTCGTTRLSFIYNPESYERVGGRYFRKYNRYFTSYFDMELSDLRTNSVISVLRYPCCMSGDYQNYDFGMRYCATATVIEQKIGDIDWALLKFTTELSQYRKSVPCDQLKHQTSLPLLRVYDQLIMCNLSIDEIDKIRVYVQQNFNCVLPSEPIARPEIVTKLCYDNYLRYRVSS